MPLSADDVIAIEQLFAEHTYHYDRRDPEPYADTFTDDGVVETGDRRQEGREQIREWVRRMRERLGSERYRHWTNNVWIEGDGDQARLRCYLAVFDNGDGRFTLAGRQEGELRRVDGKWRFSGARFTAEYSAR